MTVGERLAIRRATAADAVAVAEVYLAARHAAVPLIPPLVHDDGDVRRWVHEDLLEETEVWVADLAGVVVAMMATSPGWLDHLYVDPTHANQGIGSILVAHAQDRAKTHLDLWTFVSNVAAQRFYVRHGFVEVERTDGSGNEEQAADIRYRWSTPD